MKDQAVSLLYVGLDVHKDSVDIALARAGRDGEMRHFGAVGGSVEAVSKALRLSAPRNVSMTLRHLAS